MSELPDNIADALIAYLSEENPALDEYQARLDLARAARVAKYWDQFLKAESEARAKQGKPPRIKPTPFRVLAWEFAELSAHHTGATPSQTETGGPGARMLVTLANGADLLDPMTGASFTLQKARNTIKETRDKMNERAGLDPMERFYAKADYNIKNSTREGARVAIMETHIIGYDEEGDPVFGGYERAPDRERVAAAMAATAERLLKEA